MHKQLYEKLSDLLHQTLVSFIASLHGDDEAINQRIETMILFNDPEALHKALKKRVQSLKRGKRFINYSDSFDFSSQLDALVSDIEQGLLPKFAALAFDVLDQFLQTVENTLHRVDDSGGVVGDSYREATALWLKAAVLWKNSPLEPCHENWQERVLALFHQNDYGIFDELLTSSAELLSEDELRQLAWRFENEARNALEASKDEERNYNATASQACIGLGSVAEALRDIELYERATLIQSPEPNGLQKESLAKFCLTLDDAKAALKWLETSWESRFELTRLGLLDTCYEKLDDTAKLINVRREHYRLQPSFESLCSLTDILPSEEKAALMDQAIDDAKKLEGVAAAATMLLELGALDQAEQHLLARASDMSSVFYGSLIGLAQELEAKNMPLASILCYRGLLEDVLNRAYSKAYRHAAKYYRKLQLLDADVDDYKGQLDAAAYAGSIKEKHGRKRSFWALVNK